MKVRLRFWLGVLALAAGSVILGPIVLAEGQRAYKVGDRVEVDPMLIGRWRKATVIEIHIAGGQLNGYEVSVDPDDSRVKEEYTVGKTVERGIRPLTEPEDVPVKEKEKTEAPRPAPKSEPADTPPVAPTGCSSNAALLARPNAADSRELSFERAILSGYQRLVEEKSRLSAPLSVGIAFDGFQIGTTRVNERTLDRLDGTYMRAAPAGASLYPVKTRFSVCERFTSEVTRTLVDGRYECFKSSFGAWACSSASGWRTLDTKRERIEPR